MDERALSRLWRNRARALNNRARMFQAQGHLSGIDLRAIVERDGSECVYCQKTLNYFQRGENGEGEASFEHVVRLCDGGKNDATNVVCACRTCNGERSNQILQNPMRGGMDRLRKHLELKPRLREEQHLLPRYRSVRA